MASLIDYSQDFSTKKMMQDIEEKIKAYINKEDTPSEPKGMLERMPSPDKLDGDSIVVSSLENMIKQASENKATRFRGMDFTAERPKSSPEEINKFLSSIEGYPMNFSGSIIKERDILESDIMKDVRADAAEKLIKEAPVVDIAKAIEQDQDRQKGLMTKPKLRPNKKTATVRNVRNNNPGNIDRNKTSWEGMSADQTGDSRFVVFDSPEMGVRAMGKVLTTYQKTHKLNTISGIISRWAPPIENDTATYIKNISKELGVKPNAPIDLIKDRSKMEQLIFSIIKQEGGKEATDYYTRDIIKKGVDLVKAK